MKTLPKVNHYIAKNDDLWPADQVLVSYTHRVEHFSIWHFLTHQPTLPRLYWAGQGDAMQIAGLGWATTIKASGLERFWHIEERTKTLLNKIILLDHDLPDEIRPRFFGGFSFWDQVDGQRWQGFPAAWFGLPHYQIIQLEGQSWLTVNVFAHQEEAEELARHESQHIEDWNQLGSERPCDDDTGFVSPTVDFEADMEKYQWDAIINGALSHMQTGHLDKVVLARTAHLIGTSSPDFANVMQYLTANYPDCTKFLIEPERSRVFFGATPETLIDVSAGSFTTAALAGSNNRGATPAEDADLGAALLASAKDRHEHQLVVDMMLDKLTPITSQLTVANTPSLRRLKNIQHLETPMNGILSHGTTAIALLERLHPTPALGGIPRQSALAYIREVEPFERGWYAAPVGWVDAAGDGVFAVAIRSGLNCSVDTYLFAGAGIVSDSEPEKEWGETDLKFKPLLDALGVELDD